MKNLFELSEEEKSSIRELHESYKNKPGTKLIWEQDATFNDNTKSELDVFYFGSAAKDTPRLYHNNNSIYYFDGTTSTEIWDKNSKVSFAVDLQTGKLENGSELMDKQISLQPTFKDFLVKGGFGPLNYKWENQKKPTFYLVMFGDQGKMFLSAAAPVLISRKQAKSENLTKAVKDGDYIYAEIDKTYIPTKKGNALVAKMSFGKEISKVQPPTQTPPPPVADSFEFVLEDNFIFNTITLTPEGVRKYNEKKYELGSFLKKISRLQTTPGNTTVSDILNTDVKIYGYASIDGDPNENVTNGREIYEPCRGSGNGSRKDYNMCLSQKRAEYIANDLNNFIGEITLPDGDTILSRFGNNTVKNWAVGIGEGETSQFSGKKWPGTKGDTKATAPDRRVVFTPKLVANIKG